MLRIYWAWYNSPVLSSFSGIDEMASNIIRRFEIQLLINAGRGKFPLPA
jgi:hypothetical protein